MSTTISYKGNTLATVNDNTKTLETEGKYLEADIVLTDLPAIGLYTIRPDAELIKTYSNDSLAVHDDSATLPAWKSTAATTIKASANLSGTVSLDYTNYDYFAVERFLTIPVYNTDTIAASRNEYSFGSSMYEIVNIPANTVESFSGTKYGSLSVGPATYTCYRLCYWSSASAIGLYTSSTYGIHQVTAAPSISSGKWTFKSPTLQFRGSTTYLTEAVYNTITDIRRQFVIDVYRAPKGHLAHDAWGIDQSLKHIVDCAKTNTHTLT